MLAVAEMYIKGVSTREVEAVMREFGRRMPVLLAGQPRGEASR
jgi:transposase-like protein